MKVTFAPSARDDLYAVFDFIAADSPAVAEAFIEELTDICRSLDIHPRRFPVIGSLAGREVRRRAYVDYIILYVREGDEVRIAHVVQGSRNIASLLD